MSTYFDEYADSDYESYDYSEDDYNENNFEEASRKLPRTTRTRVFPTIKKGVSANIASKLNELDRKVNFVRAEQKNSSFALKKEIAIRKKETEAMRNTLQYTAIAQILLKGTEYEDKTSLITLVMQSLMTSGGFSGLKSEYVLPIAAGALLFLDKKKEAAPAAPAAPAK